MSVDLRRKCNTFAVCIAFLVSCSEKEEIQSVDFMRFSIVGSCEGSVLKSSEEKEKTIVIGSEQELLRETGCLRVAPQVDFNTHFVLAGRRVFNNCAELEEETILEVDNTLRYHVRIGQRECQKMDTVYFMAAVPIRYKDHQINFNITY